MLSTEQERIRLEKLDFVATTVNPYPDRFEKTHEIKDIADLPDDVQNVKTAGRIVFMRKTGKAFGVYAIYAVIDGDKPHVVSAECFHRVPHLEIVAPPSGHVFHNANADFAALHIFHHLNVTRTVKEAAAFVIINIMLDVAEPVCFGVGFKL